MEIIPIILTPDPIEARREIEQISSCKKYNRVQINFIDGEFVENITVKPDQLDLTQYLHLMWDAHLMVVKKNLDEYLGYVHKLGIDRVIAHFEVVENLRDYKNIAIDLPTPLGVLNSGMFADKELIMVLAAKAGWGGTKMDETVWEKIEWFKKIRKENNFGFKIQVKGGVQREDVEKLEKLGGVDEVGIKTARLMEWT